MQFGIPFGRSGDAKLEAYEEYLEVPEGMIRVPDAYFSLLLNESRYLLLRLVKTILALGLYAIALVMLGYGVLGGIMSLLSGFQGKGWIGPVAIVWVPLALVGAYVLACTAILCTEKYTRDTRMPGVTEVLCPKCGKETPLFRACAECGVGFIFEPGHDEGILVGLIHIVNLLLSGFWYLICAAGLLILLAGMI